jgi:hypothetical protein
MRQAATKNERPDETLIALAEFNFEFGFIGIDEYVERCEVALWLDDESGKRHDPRDSSGSEERRERGERGPSERASELPQKGDGDQSPEPDSLEFLFQNWIFTKADPDPYPSTPHGHEGHRNKKWPKLNPYTGRAFKEKHQEDVSARLNKKQMKILWDDERVRDFC